MTEPLQAIVELLREEHGIPPAKLRPKARLSHDLGVDGDDISDLFQRLHERFGTDFTELNDQWTVFFACEGASPRSLLFGLLLMMPSTALTVWLAVTFDLPGSWAGMTGVMLFFALWIALRLTFPEKQKQPVTIEGLADIVRAGAWPPDPSNVR